MGILNVTPDSFSDGGLYLDPERALRRAEEMIAEGVDIIDIGGESTRPGAEPVSAEVQIDRVMPVVRLLRKRLPAGCLLSVDTTDSSVAEVALDAGVDLINDISAGLADRKMFSVLAARSAAVVLMHMQGTPKTMQNDPQYGDVVEEIRAFLLSRAKEAELAGIRRGDIIIDPGIGFGKRKDHNLKILAELQRFVETGYAVLLGTSRKRFMGAICREGRPDELLGATVATTVLGVAMGVKIFRVHDVRANRYAADITTAILAAREKGRTLNG
ncbi:Dihydropteroate synthase [Candidatus Methylocalor cossyra]|uniref:dihydropteroate synthase n=2 Tax=Candidatus Methylocalor cossyra TaxID=3108543 RepID=A0ABM9NKR4_9GAMM